MTEFIDYQLLILQFLMFIVLFFVIIYILKLNRAMNLEKRLGKYSLVALTESYISIFDSMEMSYRKFLKKVRKILSKSVLLNKYSARYNKYIDFSNKRETHAIDYLTNKFAIGLMFLFINILARVIEYQAPSIFELILTFTTGFFTPDIYFTYLDVMRRKSVEKELINAIIIMNNAFKSGRSTMQAIEIVKNELKGPIKDEFQKMHLEISYGLSLEVVFDRFAKRVDVEEVKYITSSLTILNKTGGNIIKVFDSIEKSLFNKQKLKLELKSLTSSSNMISKVLALLPLIFGALIMFLDPSYFNTLFESTLGLMVIIVILLLYGLYLYIVQKVMKVKV